MYTICHISKSKDNTLNFVTPFNERRVFVTCWGRPRHPRSATHSFPSEAASHLRLRAEALSLRSPDEANVKQSNFFMFHLMLRRLQPKRPASASNHAGVWPELAGQELSRSSRNISWDHEALQPLHVIPVHVAMLEANFVSLAASRAQGFGLTLANGTTAHVDPPLDEIKATPRHLKIIKHQKTVGN